MFPPTPKQMVAFPVILKVSITFNDNCQIFQRFFTFDVFHQGCRVFVKLIEKLSKC